MSYIEINENTEEGFADLTFNIIKTWNDDSGNNMVQALGNFEGEIVGFQASFRKNMKPGMVENNVNNDAFYAEGISLSSIGKESDSLIKAISKLYGMKYKNEKMINKVQFTSFALDGNPQNFISEDLKFKIFHDETNKNGVYAELFINVNVEEGFIELKEKDIEYRKNLLSALTGKNPNIIVKLLKRILKKV